MKSLLNGLFSPFWYLRSFFYQKIKATPIASPSTRFKTASRHLYNQLTELLIEECPLASVDIGGTLAKMTLYIPDTYQNQFKILKQYAKYYLPELSFKTECIKGTYLFFCF